MRGALTVLMLLAIVGILVPPAWAQPAPTPPATAPAATPETATLTDTPASPKYGVAPGILLGVGVLLAGGGVTGVLVDQETLGYTGVCLGGALALTGVALIVDRAKAPAPAPDAAQADPAPVRGAVAPVVGPEFVGVAGFVQF
jgi:hypothetical protein